MKTLIYKKEVSLKELIKFSEDFKVLEQMIRLQNLEFSRMLEDNNAVFISLIKGFIFLNNAKLECLFSAKEFIEKTLDEVIKTTEGGII